MRWFELAGKARIAADSTAAIDAARNVLAILVICWLTTLDLAKDPLPHLGSEEFAAWTVPDEQRSDAQRELAALSDQLIDALFAHDTLVLAVPMSLYSLSKAALVGLTKGAARDLGARNITVNIVHPGPTDTEMNPADGDLADTLRDLMAIKRYNCANEVAAMVTWLAGPDAGTVTGAEFAIDGGSNI